MTTRETAHLIRGLVARGVVSATNDDAESQTADVGLWAGVKRKAIEILQPFGLASRPPRNGQVIVLAVGGDQGDLVALPIAAPGVRMGNLAEGETVIYGLDGSRVHIKADGAIEVSSTKNVDVKVPGARLEVRESMIRGRMDDGSRFATGPGWSKLAAGGHFVAASAAGVTVSVVPVVGPEPGAGL